MIKPKQAAPMGKNYRVSSDSAWPARNADGLTFAEAKHLSNLAPRWFEDYRDRGNSVVDRGRAMLDDARHWSTYSDPTDPDIADWYRGINADAAKAVAYLEGLDA